MKVGNPFQTTQGNRLSCRDQEGTLSEPPRLLCPWGCSRLEYWSGLPFLFPGDLPNPGIKPMFPTLHADSLPSESNPGSSLQTEEEAGLP